MHSSMNNFYFSKKLPNKRLSNHRSHNWTNSNDQRLFLNLTIRCATTKMRLIWGWVCRMTCLTGSCQLSLGFQTIRCAYVSAVSANSQYLWENPTVANVEGSFARSVFESALLTWMAHGWPTPSLSSKEKRKWSTSCEVQSCAKSATKHFRALKQDLD